MRTIWKFQLSPFTEDYEMPRGARCLHVHEQHGDGWVWAEVETANPLVNHRLIVVPTGTAIPATRYGYVGSFHLVDLQVFHSFHLVEDGLLVFHVYDDGERA